ncbi:MAG TPA: hypothetical protein EYN90_00175 [Acidobacteria bacterium]|jgi:hypothetical protein|nr:hypothetical protein [Acidobacteriota bacterium]HIN70719.1 hypothetical protein [Acidobacteriota bacterium]
MSSDRILLILIVVVSILAAIPAVASLVPGDTTWALILVVLGLVAGGMGGYGSDMTQRILIYVIAVSLTQITGSLDAIPTVGHHIGHVLNHMATGIQGIAIAVFVLAMYERIMPAKQTGGYRP